MKTILFDLDGTLIQTPEIILKAFKQTFETYLKEVDLNDSVLSNFLGQTLWQTFGFYTDDRLYSEHAKLMKASLERFGLEPYLEKVSADNWQKIIAFKPEFIQWQRIYKNIYQSCPGILGH